MNLTNPDFVYVSAADSAKPGYLHQRMELYRKKIEEQRLLAAAAARRASRRGKKPKEPHGP